MAFGFTATAGTITGTHSGFVGLFDAATFPTGALNGANAILNGGGNLRAYTDDTKTTALPLEIVSLVTGGTPEALVHVRLNSLSTSGTVYLEADDTATTQPIATDPLGRNAVWVDYKFVHHLTDTSSLIDSAGNTAWDVDTIGAGTSDSTESPFGSSSVAFNGTSTAFLDIINSESIAPTASDPLTVQMWVRPESSPADEMGIFLRNNSPDSANNSFRIFSDNANSGGGGSANTYLMQTDALATRIDDLGPNVISVNNWQSLAFVNEQSVEQSGYLDGSSIYSATTTAPALDTGNNNSWLIGGPRGFVSSYWDGQIAELRARNAKLDSDYISTEYNNQSSPSTFWTSSAWADSGGGGGLTVNESTVNYNYSTLSPSITLTGTISVTEQAASYNYSAINPTISFVGIVSITESISQVNYSANNPIIDFTGLVDIQEQTSSINLLSNDPVITLTSTNIEITESVSSINYQSFDASILLTPEPLGIVSTVCFDGRLVNAVNNGSISSIEYNGALGFMEIDGNLKELEFNGTIQTTCSNGSIKTNC